MSAKKKPRKPSQPPGHVVFPKKGRPYRVMELLPPYKNELEAVIVKKFIGALKHKEGRHLSHPVKADPWPDFVCEEAGAKIGIEVVEVINVEHARKRHLQEEYTKYIYKLIDDFYPCLSGLAITLNDGYQYPPYPPLRRHAGQRLAQSIADDLRSSLEQLENMQIDHIRVYRWQKGPHRPTTGAFVRRVAPKESGVPATLGFLGSFPESVSVIDSLLMGTIEKKLDKYTQFTEGKLILLAYDVVGPPVENSSTTPPVVLAKEVLRCNDHPFDEVWYIFPYAPMDLDHKNLGHIVKVWP